MRPRLATIAGAASDFRTSVRRARARRRAETLGRTPEHETADEVKRRLDDTRARLRTQIPPRED